MIRTYFQNKYDKICNYIYRNKYTTLNKIWIIYFTRNIINIILEKKYFKFF